MSDPSVRLPHLGPRNLNRLVEAVLSIGTELNLDAVLRRIVEAAVDLVDARYGALGVLDEHGHRLAQFITVGVDAETQVAIGDLPKGLGLLGAVIADAKPLRVAVVGEHPDTSGFPANHPPMTSFLGVPIRVHGEVFGNLYLTDKTTAEVFSDIDEELALGLASAAAVAVENARLYEKARRREAMLWALNGVATALLDGAGTGTGLTVVARTAVDLLGATRATISLLDGDDHLRVEVAAGEEVEGVVGHRFTHRGTPCGEALAGAGPIALDDAAFARIGQTPLRDGHIGPALFLALASESATFGVLTITRDHGSAPFTSPEVELGRSFAAQASVVLDHERGRHQREQSRRLDELERIGGRLHDTVIDRLHRTGLLLEGAARRTTDAALRDRVHQAVAELDATITDVRAVVFDAGQAAPRTDAISEHRGPRG